MPHRAANIRGDARIVASAPRHAAGRSRFQKNDGVPHDTWVPDPTQRSGVRRTDILGVTLPHDCANHLPGIEEEDADMTHSLMRELQDLRAAA